MSLLVILLAIAIITPFFILTVWALVNVSVKTFPGGLREKVIWWLIALIPFIGWLIYLIFGFRRGKKPITPA